MISSGPTMFVENFTSTQPPSKAKQTVVQHQQTSRSELTNPDNQGKASSSRRPSKEMSRKNSQATFADRESTLLFLDWDDTIFPSTWVRGDMGLHWMHPLKDQINLTEPRGEQIQTLLLRFYAQVEEFLKAACGLATVIIVTLAKRPWVNLSADNFLPGYSELLESLYIKVLYAREYVTDDMRQEYAENEFKSEEFETDFWMQAKAKAMAAELETFHASSGASWKNIISMGDAHFERLALLANAKAYVAKAASRGEVRATGITSEVISNDGHVTRLRTKTVKMLQEPTCEELTAQTSLLTEWLPHIVKLDAGIELCLDNIYDDNVLNEMHKSLTGEGKILCWRELVGC